MVKSIKRRRGVLLLVVLSMLVLFALISVTFVVVAGHYRRTMRAESRAGRYDDDAFKTIDSAAHQLFRGTINPLSVAIDHDLLGDFYGSDAVTNIFVTAINPPSAVPPANGQFVDLATSGLAGPPSKPDGYYNGQVLTVISGPAANQSGRIVGFNGASGKLRVMAFEPGVPMPVVGDELMINGRPFNGTGFGFDSTTGKIDAQAAGPGQYLALLPNHRFAQTANDGGADEDHDAVTPQDMLLAMVPPNPTKSADIIPSLHRPDLVSYWGGQTTIPPTDPREYILRPLRGSDNPNFTGSNLNFKADLGPSDAATFTWDVDNDGDTIADSVWVDLGFPVQTAPDGRKYRPLFAILCIDLDGRLNVNAHGNPAQLDANYTANASGAFAGGSTSLTLPRGQGYGPPDINPQIALGASFSKLLQGDTALQLEGRYGELSKASPMPGRTPLSGAPPLEEPLSVLKQFQFPVTGQPVTVPTSVLTSFAAPADLWGSGFVALDPRGMPLMPWMGLAPNETGDNPYELNVSHSVVRGAQTSGGVDNLFTVAELERTLRPYDADVTMLPSRLQELLGASTLSANDLRALITTDSYDPPVPNILLTREMRGGGAVSSQINVLDLLSRKLVTGATLNSVAPQVLPLDLIAGLRMDINRPFGNGRDDNNNGVVDEPGEANVPEYLWTGLPYSNIPQTSGLANTIPFDHNNDGRLGAPAPPPTPPIPDPKFGHDREARQLYARNLYCLLMLLTKVDALGNPVPIEFDGAPGTSTTETARGLAQWAVNVVDFCDRDSIMTAFEYDEEPFDGWSTDGDLTTTTEAKRGVVWGCERPELLITETLAWHDPRTEDLSTEVANNNTPDPNALEVASTYHAPPPPPNLPQVKDRDFDQRLRPRGSFFVELYNPWGGAEAPPGELYDANGQGVMLNKVNKDSSGVDWPVWRLLIVNSLGGRNSLLSGQPKDPDDPVPSQQPAAGDIERIVYFAQPPAALSGSNVFYSSLAIAPLRPGHYAVVGGYSKPTGSDYESPVGREMPGVDGGPITNTRKVVLTPGNNFNHQVQVLNNQRTPAEPSTPDIQPVVAAVIDQPLPLTVSEPIGGYTTPPTTTWDPMAAGGEGAYTQVLDTPLDAVREFNSPGEWAALIKTGTTQNFRRVYLQRLANPLDAWNSTTNPYLTVDSMSVDLTAFNGVSDKEDPGNGLPAGTNPSAADTVPFVTRQRSEAANNIWAPTTQLANAKNGASGHYFNAVLGHSLGYLNERFAPAYVAPPDAPTAAYAGSPKDNPFPWLTWNNRPYVSPMELLLVPKSRSSRLLPEFNFGSTTPYAAPPAPAPNIPIGHLLNLLDKSAGGPQLYRIFEYLQVPSRFVGAETMLNPSTFAAGSGVSGTDMFHPPFNKVSNYRDPGRGNINTIFDARIWDSFLAGHPGPSYAEIDASRRGGAARGSSPSDFANPFRSFGGAPLNLPPAAGAHADDVDVTLMRPSGAGANGTMPLLAGNSTSSAYNDSSRNPYFRYQELQRMSNLLTTHSNVYAIWITVGYFEVEPVTPDPIVHPDGYQLGAELGSDRGEVKRHRGFYIFDRSIPVGYQTGQDFNVDRAILLKRFIE